MRRWTFSLLLITGIVAGMAPRAEAIVVMGQAAVIDPETIVVGGQMIRLFGVAPPGRGSICLNSRRQQVSCWEESAWVLGQVLDGRDWYCEGNFLDAAGRLLGMCRSGDLVINEFLVSRGWCRANGSHQGMLQLEMNARNQRLGIWQMQ